MQEHLKSAKKKIIPSILQHNSSANTENPTMKLASDYHLQIDCYGNIEEKVQFVVIVDSSSPFVLFYLLGNSIFV